MRRDNESKLRWGWVWIERMGQDLRYAGRMMRRRPAFSIAAILTLALGIGANTAMFSLLHALLMKTLPVERPEQLLRLIEQGRDPASYRDAFTLDTHTKLERGSEALSGVIASSIQIGRPGEIEDRGEKVPVFVQMVSDNYFDVLGVPAFRGRLFHRSESGSPGDAIAVISADYWRRHYGGDLSALGARFQLNRREFTIAGIAPAGFRGTEIDVPADIWVSFEQLVAPDSIDRSRGRWMRIMARPRPGIMLAQVEAEISAIIGRPLKVEAGATGYSALRRRLSRPLLLVELVVAMVLLITCANLANLMLAATASRDRELAVRRAVGASRARIVRQLLTESLLLSVAGGALALAAARWINAALLTFVPPDQAPALTNFHFDLNPRVLGFTALLSCGTCVFFGLAPALRATAGEAPDLRAGAGAGQRGRSWFSRGLLVSQVVLCTLLLIVASVFLRSLQNLRGQETGYRQAQLLVADVQPPREYPENRRDQLIEGLRSRVASFPGVEVAAFSHLGQLSGLGIEYRLVFPNRPKLDAEEALEQRVSPGFLRAMGTTLLAGRDFSTSDGDRSNPVAIVNESFVRKYLSDVNPIGAHFSQEGGSRSGELMEVVGVVKDSKWINLRDDFPVMYYRPYAQQGGSPIVRFAIRTAGDPAAIAAPLLQAAQTLDRRMLLRNVVPFRDIVDRALVIERLVAQVSAAFGALALLIAAVGLYGVLAYSVVRRRREIGIRIAVGAPSGSVEWMLLRESLTLLGCGVVIGVPAALLVVRLVSSMLYGLSPHDPGSIVFALAVLSAATVAAAYVPARRAASTDPIVALREE